MLSIQLEASEQRPHVPGDATPHPAAQWRDLKREKGGEKYRVVTREYLAQGHDGFESFKGERERVSPGRETLTVHQATRILSTTRTAS